MKKIIIIIAATTSIIHAATGFKSTQDAKSAIASTYNTLLQAPNIFDKSVSFKELVELGDKLNAHIMGKQGVLLGSKSKKRPDVEHNIFDLWDHTFDRFTHLINTLKEERLTGNKHGKGFEGLGWQLMAFERIIRLAKNIYQESILSDKKKLSDIIIFFAEHAMELIKKADPTVG
jgi:hypothetical protein